MSKYDLSILIPARNEMFLAKTVESVLKAKRGKTEILIALDGKFANPPITDHPDITIVFFPESLGQRGATNQLARLSQAKYVMKLDAHCDLDEGFDVKMMAVMQDNWTLVPLMRNLHAFDWKCVGSVRYSTQLYFEKDTTADGCGWRSYQAPTPKDKECPKCGALVERELIWYAKPSPRSTSFMFDKTLHFQYFNEFKKRPEGQGELTETLSIQGSCFMLTRQKYWELNICDEEFGSWGQQGVEVACKTWLSGGRVMCLQSTWYAHMFRTQGGDFSFPYPQSGKQIQHAREYSRELFEKGKWPGALPGKDLNWLLDKFAPVPGWHDEKPSKGIVFYTDNELTLKIAHRVQKQLRTIGLPITSASLKPMPHFGKNINVLGERGIDTYFRQIIAALEESTADVVYMCEHDVIYHPSHFDFIPPKKDRFYYNVNFWRIRPGIDNLAVHWDANQVSGLVAYRTYVLQWYKEKYEHLKVHGFDRSYEPGGRDPQKYEQFKSAYPNIDVRHKGNLTKSKWSINDFRDKSTCVNWQEATIETIPGWQGSDMLNMVASA
jgi:glycosyltransferase involved in cell wall biosynthesis